MKKSSSSRKNKDEIIDIDDVTSEKIERNKAIMEMVFAGYSYRYIAEEFSLTPGAISYVALQNGFVKRPEVANRIEIAY